MSRFRGFLILCLCCGLSIYVTLIHLTPAPCLEDQTLQQQQQQQLLQQQQYYSSYNARATLTTPRANNTNPPQPVPQFSYKLLQHKEPSNNLPSYYKLPQFSGKTSINATLASPTHKRTVRVGITPRVSQHGAVIGVPYGLQDLMLVDADPIVKSDFDALATYLYTSTYLFNQTVLDIDSNGYISLFPILGGAPSRLSLYHSTDASVDPSQQLALINEIRGIYQLRPPFPILEDVYGKVCDHKSDIVVLNDIGRFLSEFPSIGDCVTALRCATEKVLLINTAYLPAPLPQQLKMELLGAFADLEVLPVINGTTASTWIAAYTKLFDRPATFVNIRRGAMDVPLFLHHIADAYPSLPFKNVSLFVSPPRCRSLPEPVGKNILDKIMDDPFNYQEIGTCMFKYHNGSSIIKIATGDWGMREEYFINKLYQVDPVQAEVFFPKAWFPYLDPLTGLSSSSIQVLDGNTIGDTKTVVYSATEYLQFTDDAISILEMLQKANIIHRDLGDRNVVVRNTKQGKRLAVIDFMYSVSSDMPFMGYTPAMLNYDHYPKGYLLHCDMLSVGTMITRRFQTRYPHVSNIAKEMVSNTTCIPDIPRLRSMLDELWKRERPNGRPSS